MKKWILMGFTFLFLGCLSLACNGSSSSTAPTGSGTATGTPVSHSGGGY